MNRKLFVIGITLTALAMVMIAILITLVVKDRSRNVSLATTVNTPTVTLGDRVSLTFPCDTHTTDLSAQSKIGMHAYAADCATRASGTDQGTTGVIYSALLEQYPDGSHVQQAADAAYCTGHSSYPGTKAGSTIYPIQPYTLTVQDESFNACALAYDTPSATIEGTARTSIGQYGLIVEIDEPTPVPASTIRVAMHTFVSTVRFKK